MVVSKAEVHLSNSYSVSLLRLEVLGFTPSFFLFMDKLFKVFENSESALSRKSASNSFSILSRAYAT